MKRFIIFSFILIFSQISFSQSFTIHPSILDIHYNLYSLSSASGISSFKRTYSGFGISYLSGLNKRMDWKTSIDGAFIDNNPHNSLTKSQLLLTTDISLRINLLFTNSRFKSYIYGGTGIFYTQKNIGSFIHIGPGFEMNYKDVFFLFSIQYQLPITITLPQHICFSLGIAGLISHKKLNKSINIIKDNSAIIILRQDKDGDGIPDSEDECPDKPGLAVLKGCPADQVTVIENKSKALLPEAPKKDTSSFSYLKKYIDEAARHILFETNSFKLQTSSYPYLDLVAHILIKDPSQILQINGYTDNTGSSAFNLRLSQKRANAIKGYLIEKGINSKRLTAIGYGAANPVADNRSTTGKARNRRVELMIQSSDY